MLSSLELIFIFVEIAYHFAYLIDVVESKCYGPEDRTLENRVVEIFLYTEYQPSLGIGDSCIRSGHDYEVQVVK